MITNITNTPCTTQTLNNPQNICAGHFYLINNRTYSTTGNYIDTIQNVFACNNIVILNTQLTVNALPNLSVSTVFTICANDSITLVPSGASSYTWNNNSYFSQFTTPPFATTGTFIYTIQLQGKGNAGCVSSNTISINVLVQPCDVGIKLKDLLWFSDNINLFPNPTSDKLNISFPAQADIKTYSISNSLGQIFREDEIEIKNSTCNVLTSDLKNGLYQIHFKTQFGIVTKKFVKTN